MGKAKDIVLKPIKRAGANAFVKKWHYSKKIVPNSSLHIGVFLHGKLGGVMSFGSPTDKRKVLGLVKNKKTGRPASWSGMMELNRMAFSPLLPRNSESRALAISFKLIKKHAPQIKWILSFSDATQCGDGTIYRAAGFKLTAIRKNSSIIRLADGTITTVLSQTMGKKIFKNGGSAAAPKDAEPLKGYQLRYIKILYPEYELNCPDIPYSKIGEMGAGMYKGEKRDNDG